MTPSPHSISAEARKKKKNQWVNERRVRKWYRLNYKRSWRNKGAKSSAGIWPARKLRTSKGEVSRKTTLKNLNGHANGKIKLNARKQKSSDVKNDRSCYQRSFLQPQEELSPRRRKDDWELGHGMNPESQEDDKNLSGETFHETSGFTKN